jgi:serine/threonine-protein kinase
MGGRTCPSCGGVIEADHPGGLCPACLLKEGLRTDGRAEAAPSYCPACQSTLGTDARFCDQCGAPVPVAAAEGDAVRTALEAKLRGQYRIVRLLGRGGMGAVYLARDLALDREVAVKVVKTGGPEIHDRLRREARTAARLSHPNIVPLHAFGEVEGMPYFVMGYVRGESLATRLRRDGKLPEEEARRVLAELADALDHAHRQGVVHRDVKPDNVLLDDESGRAMLTDFGVAKALGRGETLTSTGGVVGTPHYMSPEQAAGRADLDPRSDLYSLGVMAYGMLTGRLPFDGKTAAEILSKHLTQEPQPLRSLAPALSDSTLQTVERCLAKDPARRFADARSLKLALGVSEEPQLPDTLRAVEGQGILAAYIVLLWMILMRETDAPWWVLALASGMFAFMYLFATFRLMREGLSLAQAQRVIWTEPSWWPLWYPRALRRRGSVWDRLPAAVRRVRELPVVATACVAAYAVLHQTFVRGRWLDRPAALHLGLFVAIVLFGGGTLVLWWALMARARRELQRKGLDSADANRVALAVPLSRVRFWTRPHIAATLAPAPSAEAARAADSPHDQLQSILRNGDALSGALRPLGAQAAAAARQLLAAIEHADGEIAALARSVEPGEQERLAGKLEALGGAAPVAAAPMRQLLERQLELVRELTARLEGTRDDRERRVEMLKMLALHLASLRARSAEAPGEVPSLSAHVQALCDEIASQAQALAGARAAASRGMEHSPTLDRPGHGETGQ